MSRDVLTHEFNLGQDREYVTCQIAVEEREIAGGANDGLSAITRSFGIIRNSVVRTAYGEI